MRRGGFAIFILAGLFACSAAERRGVPNGPSEGQKPDFAPAAGALMIDPANAIVYIDTATGKAATQKFVVKKGDRDITADTKFSLGKSSLGFFKGSQFTSVTKLPSGKRGVTTVVKADSPEGPAEANLTIVALERTGADRDFFFVVPYGKPPEPESDVLRFKTNIRQVDVAFVMDTTGSMSGAIMNLQSALSTTLISQLSAAIPSVGIAVVDHRDYPDGGFGSFGDWPVKVHQVVTTNVAAAKAAVSLYAAGGGGDGPESQIPAMQHVLTGEALGTYVSAHTPKSGTWGGVDFRPGTLPVIVLITDTNWHDTKVSPYSFTAPTMGSLKVAFANKKARFVSVSSGEESQADELSDATGSSIPPAAFGNTCGANQCCTDYSGGGRAATGPKGTCRLNFRHEGGDGVSSGVVTAIKAISRGTTFDVSLRVSNGKNNEDDVDATQFIQALRAMGEGDADNDCDPAETKDTDGDGIDDTFVGVTVGAPVCFEVIPAMNETVEPADEAKFYSALVDVVGVPGDVQLDEREVIFLVPPKTLTPK
jgi:hypothetical protein